MGFDQRTFYASLCSNVDDLSKISWIQFPGFWDTRQRLWRWQLHAATSSSYQSANYTRTHTCTHTHAQRHPRNPSPVVKILCNPAIPLALTSHTFSINTLPCRQRSHAPAPLTPFAWNSFLSGLFPFRRTWLIPPHHSDLSVKVDSLRKTFWLPSSLSRTAGSLWVRGQ